MNNIIHCAVPDNICRVRIQIWRIMRLSFIFIFAALMQVSASSLAQKITLSERQATLETILQKIRLQTGYDFLYDVQAIKAAKPIDINVRNSSLADALNSCLAGQDFSFTIDDKSVIIRRKEPSFPDNLVARFTDIDVRGRVVDEQGNPLPNASIQVKGKAKVYNSNEKGEFSIPDVADDAILVIRYVGYKMLEIAVKDAVMPLEIKLNVATGELEEVKVTYSTGYQNIPKERATGSFVQIDNETINRGVSTNILDRIAYLTSSLKKGNTGSQNTDLSIRGISTISSNSKPLIVIDGFPYEENNSASFTFSVQLNNLNPNDVESITILRDAAAASIWGARSANGVIVITTKRGRFNQKASISFTGSTTLTERPDLFKLDLMSSSDAIDYEKKLFASGLYDAYNGPFAANYGYAVVSPAIEILLARKRNSITQQEANEQLAELSNHDTRDDINKYLVRNGVTQQYNFNVSGGGEKMSYYSSVGYNKNNSSNVGNNARTLTLNLNNTFRPIKNLELNAYINYNQTTTEANGIGYSQFIANGNNKFAPYTMLADANGNPMHVPISGSFRTAYLDTVKTIGLLDWHYRPLDELNNQDNINKSFNLRFGGAIKYTIMEGLSVDLIGQYNRTTINNDNYQSLRNYITRDYVNRFMFLNASGQPQYPVPLGGILDISNQIQNAYDLRSTLNFNKTWGKHGVSAISGIDIRESQYDTNQSRRYGYDPLTLTYANNINYGTTYVNRPNGVNRLITENGVINGFLVRNYSYYGNVGYSLLSKYRLSASGRVDAANLFGMKANLRAKPNWSVGTAWDISREDFFKTKTISSLIIRATYGYNGNVDNSATSLPVIFYGTNSQTYQRPIQYASRGSSPNPGITWEKVRVINYALDFGMFSNRMTGSLEYYRKKATNLIAPGPPVDKTSGVSSYRGNFGAMKSKGIDLILKGIIFNSAVKLKTDLNVSYNMNEVTEYYSDASLLNNALFYLSGSVLPIGKPRSSLYSYRWGGLDSQSGNPMGIINGQVVPFVTVLGSTGGVSNTRPSDLVYHGQTAPIVSGNVMNDISYKGFAVSFNITYDLGYYLRRSSVDFNTLQTNYSTHGDYRLRWRKVGDEMITNVPSMPITSDNRYEFYKNSEVLVEKGDNIRLRDIRLIYNLNKKNIKKIPFKNISLSLIADNLNMLLWRANKVGIDPDFNNTVPNPRSIAFGLNLNY
jgi:TonB-linked SusC/RagA family outer membrane protein